MESPDVVYDALTHFGSGVFLSILGQGLYYKFSQSDVVDRNTRVLDSIDKILDAEPKTVTAPPRSLMGCAKEYMRGQSVQAPTAAPLDKLSLQYAQNVAEVRDYLLTQEVPLTSTFFERCGAQVRVVRSMGFHSLSFWPTVGAATVLEVGWDSLLHSSAYAHIFNETAAGSLWRNLYQIPALTAGLYVGRAATLPFRHKENKHRRQIRKLLQSTNIIDIVESYQAPEQVRAELEVSVSDYARKVGGKVSTGVRRLTSSLSDRGEKVRAVEDQHIASLRTRYKNITEKY